MSIAGDMDNMIARTATSLDSPNVIVSPEYRQAFEAKAEEWKQFVKTIARK